MIEDKELGLKISENPEETFWAMLKDRTEKALNDCEHEKVVQAHVLKLCIEKLGKRAEKPVKEQKNSSVL